MGTSDLEIIKMRIKFCCCMIVYTLISTSNVHLAHSKAVAAYWELSWNPTQVIHRTTNSNDRSTLAEKLKTTSKSFAQGRLKGTNHDTYFEDISSHIRDNNEEAEQNEEESTLKASTDILLKRDLENMEAVVNLHKCMSISTNPAQIDACYMLFVYEHTFDHL